MLCIISIIFKTEPNRLPRFCGFQAPEDSFLPGIQGWERLLRISAVYNKKVQLECFKFLLRLGKVWLVWLVCMHAHMSQSAASFIKCSIHLSVH